MKLALKKYRARGMNGVKYLGSGVDVLDLPSKFIIFARNIANDCLDFSDLTESCFRWARLIGTRLGEDSTLLA